MGTALASPITLAHCTGQLIGTFLLRFASCPSPWLQAALAKARQEMHMDTSGQLLGKRRHRDNPTSAFYTFEEWVEYIHYHWVGSCPMEYASVLLAKDLWLKECVPEDISSCQGFYAMDVENGWRVVSQPFDILLCPQMCT